MIQDSNVVGSGHIGCYRQSGEDPKNYRYRNIILTNALVEAKKIPECKMQDNFVKTNDTFRRIKVRNGN